MSETWRGATPPDAPRLGPRGWARAFARGAPLALVVFGGLGLMLVVRLVERPLHGLDRPWTPHITCVVCRIALRLLGIGYRRDGRPQAGAGVEVANHTSWLDIFVLNAAAPLYFVSKAEVAGWPGIGWLARATGTVFIRRERRDARAQVALLAARLRARHRLLVFPEGTSTDGRRVLPFRPTLFAAILDAGAGRDLVVQPVTLVYAAPPGEHPAFYGWWGDMAFGPHLLKILAARRQGSVRVVYHAPLATDGVGSRKAIAGRLEAAVRAGLET